MDRQEKAGKHDLPADLPIQCAQFEPVAQEHERGEDQRCQGHTVSGNCQCAGFHLGKPDEKGGSRDCQYTCQDSKQG